MENARGYQTVRIGNMTWYIPLFRQPLDEDDDDEDYEEEQGYPERQENPHHAKEKNTCNQD
jgi:hypothetical protein